MPKLLIQTGQKKGVSYRVLDQPVTIGRDPSNTVVLPDASISRVHARIVPREKHYLIEDLGSVNGTFVNRKRVASTELEIGDRIRVGQTSLHFLHLRAPEATSNGEETSSAAAQILPERPEDQALTIRIALPLQDTSLSSPDQSSLSDLNKAYDRLSLLYHLIQDLVTIVDFPEVLNKTLQKVIDLVKGDRALIIMLDEETGDFVPYMSRNREGLSNQGEISISRAICREVLHSGQSLLTSDAMEDRRFQGSESVVVQRIRTAMSAPIKGKEKLLGMIHVDSIGRLTTFSREDLELLTAIGCQAGIAIENAMLFDETRKAHRELQERQSQLLEAEKLAALGKIAGGVVHEVINPMTVIMGFTGMVTKKLEQARLDPESVNECLQRLKSVEEEAKRVLEIVENISQFYRRRKSVRTLTDIHGEIEAALKIAEYRRSSGIEIVKEFTPFLPAVMADRSQLQAVFLNLINNAMDAVETLGTITITTMGGDKGSVKIRIADTGCGIDPAIKDKVFTPLFTTKEEGKGTGLGLSITHDIIENHGGSIDVESSPGKGAAFTVMLPAGTGSGS